MKYLGEKRTVKVVEKEIRNIEYMRCDRCNKKILPCKYKDEESAYIHIHTWHNDWGYDSIDSHEYTDLCKDCAKKFIAEYIDEANGTEELEFELKHLFVGKQIECSNYKNEGGLELAKNDIFE